jgi:hypothetical protein
VHAADGADKGELAKHRAKINDPLAIKLVEAAINLDRVSAQAKRPELGDDISEQLSDCNPPLPCLLAVFIEADSVAAAFDEEADGMLEVTPEPNLIIPFDPTDVDSVRVAFRVLGAASDTITVAKLESINCGTRPKQISSKVEFVEFPGAISQSHGFEVNVFESFQPYRVGHFLVETLVADLLVSLFH